MDDMLTAYFVVERLSPIMVLALLAGIFAAVRHSERVKPLKTRWDG